MNAHADPYRAFLEAKVRLAPAVGFEVPSEAFNPILKPHQRDIARWALRGGRRAIFCAFGLGKTFMQIEVSRVALAELLRLDGRAGRALIVLPLGVRHEFAHDAHVLATGDHPDISDAQRAELAAWLDGHPERAPSVRFIRSSEEVDGPGIYLTNYESVREGKLDVALFDVASLDEASVLRSYGSKTFQTFLALFDKVPLRFVATAAPSPNRNKELIHYAGFLGVMDTGQALTRFFQRDSSGAGNLTLYPHKEREFWLWVNSWACFVQRPSDLGHSDEGYDLPPVKVTWHEVEADIADAGFDRDGQGILLRGGARGLMQEAKERRDTLPARIARMSAIIAADPASHRIIWHDLEDERRAIEKALPDVRSVYGAQDPREQEKRIIGFARGEFALLAGKPVMLGSGCNFQRFCHKAIFVGVSHKFNDFIQAIHRIARFLQRYEVEIDIIHAESEREVVRDLQAKWAEHDRLVATMSEIIRQYGLDPLNFAAELTRAIGVTRVEATGEGWQVANNDCVLETRSMADRSVDLIVTSIPFSNHYEYTPSYNDFGHTDNDEHFFGQMDHLTPELIRVLKPGRLACIHVKDRILFGNVTGLGFPTVNPFHAKCIGHYQKHGLAYMGLIYVDTDVVRENNQTYRLTYKELKKDATTMGVGSPEFILLFRKMQSDRGKGYADCRVPKDPDEYSLARWQIDAHARWRSSGNRLLTPEELMALDPKLLPKLFREQSGQQLYDFETHVRIGEALAGRQRLPSTYMAIQPGTARPDVWPDVNRMLTLNTEQAAKGREQHVCPLQFDIVDRLIERFSNKGELVFDPFGGLFTVPMRAIMAGRQGRAAELNPTYFLDGVKVLEATQRKLSTITLFDIGAAEGWLPEEGAAA